MAHPSVMDILLFYCLRLPYSTQHVLQYIAITIAIIKQQAKHEVHWFVCQPEIGQFPICGYIHTFEHPPV